MNTDIVGNEEIPVQAHHSATVLANGAALATTIIRRVAGNDISDGVDGNSLTRTELNNAMAAKIGSYLINPTGDVK